MNAMGEHQSDAPGHQSGLATAGTRFDEQCGPVIEKRALARIGIRKGRGGSDVRHHSIAQSGVRSDRRSAISGNFSSK